MRTYFLLLASAILLAMCSGNGRPEYTSEGTITGHSETRVLQHPEWSRNATIYEVNIRQHTPEGTFAAFEKDLPRLKQMGITILWLMPIYPIGEENRKGSLGSPYSVKDYTAANPAYGSMEDFKRLVNTAHYNGMKVILDWVANHTAWDHKWVKEHPDWYTRDTSGTILAPVADWSDVADLNYDSREMQHAMIDAMQYWVETADIDGYRCDVAMMVPTLFWNDVRTSLDSIKPVFMLAEAEQKDHHLKAFDMSYSWEFMHVCNEMAKGKKKTEELDAYLARQDTAFPRSAYRMMFTTNHDENSWNGTGYERLGPGRQVYDVLAYTLTGMPLMYTSQEGGEQYEDGKAHRLRFFEKDTVYWNNYRLQDFYSKLMHLHRENPALWNGEYGGEFKKIKTSSDDWLYCFSRRKDNNEVVVLLNFSDKPQKVDFIEKLPDDNYRSIFNSQLLTLFTKGSEELPAYGYQVFVKK